MRAQAHDARSLARGAFGLGLPLYAHAGEKIGSGRRLLRDNFMIERSVVPDSRSTDEDGRWSGGGGDGFDEPTGGAHAAVENALLLRVGPALGGDWFASEIDHRVGAVNFGQPCAAWSVRRPLHQPNARGGTDAGRAPG